MRRRGNPVNNQLQKDMWNGRAGASWVRHNSLLEELLSEPGRRCMALFDLPSNAQVLDVGCGCGNQTLEWAARLDPSSNITGVDISTPMLALAEDLKSANKSSLQANVSFVLGDASEALFPETSFDAIYSRFGVMFFADPTAAFATLRSTLKPEGQLGFVCWQSPALNPFFTAPMQAALTVLPPPPPAKPGAPGPFGLSDKERTQHVLSEAGFAEITIEPLQLELSAGAGRSFDDLFQELIQIGPAATLIAESEPPLAEHARAAVYERLGEFYSSGSGVRFEANFWLVSARR
jgi:ubiquinone/menaquinone biosynthesis C-methylase UbiE